MRAAWAPRGKTPVLGHRFSRERLPVSGALGGRPGGSQAALVFQVTPGSYDTGSLVAFLEDLRGYFAGAEVTLVRDSRPSRKSAAARLRP